MMCIIRRKIIDKTINILESKKYEISFEKQLIEGSEELIWHDLLAESDCILEEIDFEKFKEELGGDSNIAHIKSNQFKSFGNISLF